MPYTAKKTTVNQIVASQNHYLIALKKNQKTLYESLIAMSKNQFPQSFTQEEESSHGRRVQREVSVFAVNERENLGWTNLQTFIQVERRVSED